MTHRTIARALRLAAVVILASTAIAGAEVLNASQLAFRSTGAVAANDVTLRENGYVGTYITLATRGQVGISVSATGVSDGGAAPRLNVVVADDKHSFDVAAGVEAYACAVTLPAGTHFVRCEFDNASATAPGRALTIRSVQTTGATVANEATDANALAAANTYITHFRRGDARVALVGPGDVPLLEGTQVRARLVRHAFHFGGTLSGSTLDDPKDMLGDANPSATSQAGLFQAFVKANFNTFVGSNSGKWANNEAAPGQVDMRLPDRQLDWAQANHKRARMHTLVWGSGIGTGRQQPDYVNALIARAVGGDANAKLELRRAISNRIRYFAGAEGKRSLKYLEVDGLNESLHNPSYMNIFGNDGMADIYAELHAALKAVGSPARTYLNEYNVLQFSPASIDPATGKSAGFDPYANYYRRHIDDLRAAGAELGGIGVQYYGNFTQGGEHAHSASTLQKALGTLSVAGLPISLTEFGGTNSMGLAQNAAGVKVLDEAMRIVFGTPNATTFLIWGWWDLPTNPTPPAALLDNTQGNAALTPMGVKWQELMAEFSTDVAVPVDAEGRLAFNGFYGDYNIGNQPGFSNLELIKGTTTYTLKLLAPPAWSFFDPAGGNAEWASATRWSAGIPDGAGLTAHFMPASHAQSVALDAVVTLGQLNFDGTNAFTLAGRGAIALEHHAGRAAINVIAGHHEVNVPLALRSDLRAVVREATSSLTLRALQDAPQRTLTKSGHGTLAIDHIRLRRLHIAAGAVSMLPSPYEGEINVVGALAIDAGGALDIGDSIWAVGGDASPANLVAEVRALIAAGQRSAGGIRSREVDERLAIGYASAGSVPASVLGGAALDSSAIIVRVTLPGDANLDGRVDFADLFVLAAHRGSPLEDHTWSRGDWNGDGTTGFDDFARFALNFGARIEPSSKDVLKQPEADAGRIKDRARPISTGFSS